MWNCNFFSLFFSSTDVPWWMSMVTECVCTVCWWIFGCQYRIIYTIYALATHKYHSNQYKSLSFVMLKSQLKHSSSIEHYGAKHFHIHIVYVGFEFWIQSTKRWTLSDFDENHFIDECFCLIEVTLNEFPST